MLPPELLRTSAAELGIPLDLPTCARLANYVDRLATATVNVTGTRVAEDLWSDHVRDALTLLPLLPDGPARLIDVGSGGGLPGIPLAIVREDLDVTLLEATSRKTAFLAACVEGLELPRVTVLTGRAEDAAHDPALRERFDVATCRAVGSLRELCEYTLPFLAVGGRLLAPKAKSAEVELAAADRALSKLGGANASIRPTGHGQRNVILVTKGRSTPKTWPRPPGRPRQAPL